MQKLKEYILNNKLFIAIMVIGFILLFIQMNQVVLYADDFSLANIHKNQNIFEYLLNHYKTWGGGYTGCLVMLLLDCGIGMWKILNTFVIAIMIGLGTRMITYKNNKGKSLVALSLWILFFFISIYTTKESIYWLDGSVAYVLSTFELFMFIYLIYSKLIIKDKIGWYDYLIMPIFGLFSGWSSAQTGILALFITLVILLWVRLKKKEKINLIIWISIALCAIGCAIFYLSPGNSMRMEEFDEYSQLNMLEKIEYRVSGVYSLMFDFKNYDTSGMPFYTLLVLGLISTIGIQYAINEKNKFFKYVVILASICIIGFLIMTLLISFNILNLTWLQDTFFRFSDIYELLQNGQLYIKILMPYILTSMVMILTVIDGIYISIRKKDILVISLLLTAFLSQGIMVMAPYSPLRTTFTSILFYIIIVGYMCHLSMQDELSVVLPFLIVTSIYNFYFGVIIVFLLIGIKNIKIDGSNIKKELFTIITMFAIMSLGNWYLIYDGYKENKKIYNENINIIEAFKEKYPTVEEQKNKELILKRPLNDKYEFVSMAGIDWVDQAVKEYFEIDNSVVLRME